MSERISNPGDLKALRDKAKGEIELREGGKEIRLTVHMGTCGIAAGARDVVSMLMSEIEKSGANNVSLRQAGCAGLCDQEPMLTLLDKTGREYRYGRLDRNKVVDIVREHVQGGTPVTRLLVNA
jgi:NADP-reducing hydrogenase subunit HndB